MKLVIQRVIESNLTIDKKIYSSIGYGMVIFIGISTNDNESFLNKIASKVSKLRIFNDEFGKMNKNINAAQILGVNKSSLQTEFKDRQISSCSCNDGSHMGDYIIFWNDCLRYRSCNKKFGSQ